jgi:hypothetical protein
VITHRDRALLQAMIMAKITTTLVEVVMTLEEEETGECIDVQHNAQDRRWPFYNLFAVSSGLGFFSARIMFLPGIVQSVFDVLESTRHGRQLCGYIYF